MAEVNWSREAKKDLKAIAEFFETSSPEYSRHIIKSLFDTVSRLREHPKIGRPIPEFEAEIFRERIVENFRIIYLLQDNKKVEILTIVHCRQDLTKHLKRLS